MAKKRRKKASIPRAAAKRPSPKRATAPRRDQQAEAESDRERSPLSHADDRFPIAGIGASAGGLEAYTHLLGAIPRDTGIGFVLVQHLDPTHESLLAGLLAPVTPMPVVQASDGLRVRPDHVYVIPPNTDMVIRDSVLHLSPRAEGRRQHMPIDTFLRSLAEDQQGFAIGVVLSGTSSDGVLGITAVKAAGGVTFAQDERTAKYGSMPHNAVASGSVDFVLPPDEIAREIERIGRHPYVRGAAGIVDELPPETEGALGKIFVLLRNASGVDFSLYKQNTIKRRVKRRMVLHRMHDVHAYLEFVREHPEEITELYEDMLVNVTAFFRDAEMFEALQTVVFPALLGSATAGFRAWVPGCSTGEEAYSLAIALFEYLGDRTVIPIQIFATDVSESAIEKARAGIYRESSVSELSHDRMRRYFTKSDGGFQISKTIRDVCVFARQDVTKDPPFSRLDLVSCRNVLIYLSPILQKQVIPIFHYALKPGGYLMLGTSESISGSELFNLVDRKGKVYSKKPAMGRPTFEFAPAGIGRGPDGPKATVSSDSSRRDTDIQREADRVLLGIYAPAGVLVNEEMQILQFRGRTGEFLEPPPGHATLDLVRMAREGLALELRTLLHKAKRAKGPVRAEGVRYFQDGREKRVNLEILPLAGSVLHPPGERFYLVVFEPQGGRPGPSRKGAKADRSPAAMERGEIARLRRELAATKEHLQATVEEQEAVNEELKSANEEILSSNEELQSTNEELETAKEELQSSNEELTTVNEELENRNLELTQVNNDISNLIGSVSLPIIILGADLRIRRFTPTAEKVMNLIPSDVGRRITDIKPNLEIPDLEALLQEAFETVRSSETTIRDTTGHWYSLRIRPYRTLDHRIEGAVMILVDVDQLKHSLDDLQESHAYAQSILDTVNESLLVLDRDLVVRRANRSFRDVFGVDGKEIEEQSVEKVVGGALNRPEFLDAVRQVASGRVPSIRLELTVEPAGRGMRFFLVGAAPLRAPQGLGRGRGQVLVALTDMTEQLRAESAVGELSGKLLNLRDEEQRRIARELHDSTAQNASALAMTLALVLESTEGIGAVGRRLLVDSRALAEQTARELRDLASLLHPPFLDEVGLVQAIRHHLDSFARRTGIEVELEAEDIDHRLPTDVEMALFRIVQESLANVQRHSGSKSVQVALDVETDHVRASIRDEGNGFDVEGNGGRANNRGVGIDGMKERAKLLGGKLELRSGKDGTTVEVRIPISMETA